MSFHPYRRRLFLSVLLPYSLPPTPPSTPPTSTPSSNSSARSRPRHVYFRPRGPPANPQKGQSTDAVLQSAQQTLLRDPKTSHPFYWAAFGNVKGPRSRRVWR